MKPPLSDTVKPSLLMDALLVAMLATLGFLAPAAGEAVEGKSFSLGRLR
jgi:hypothetical protein